jgi:hypothetical protein
MHTPFQAMAQKFMPRRRAAAIILTAMATPPYRRAALWLRTILLLGLLAAAGASCVSRPVSNAVAVNGSVIIAPGGTIELSTPQPLPVPQQQVRQWVGRAAAAVSHFYGRYPVPHVLITVLPASRGAIDGGEEIAGRQIHIRLGPRTRWANLADDWMMTHEMFHLSQPAVAGDYSWISEGMADYLEPVARVQIGQITSRQFWQELVEGLPQGEPDYGDEGLDNTHTWGRTYWGGCLYWLLADVRIRQQTDNRRSVRDAAKAVLYAGGNGSQVWTLQRLLAAYDQGTGTHVFEQLHAEMGDHPDPVDLPALWKSLGVIYRYGQVSYDDHAPLAAVRRGITAR